MDLVRLDTTLEAMDLVPALAAALEGRLVLRCTDGDAVMAAAALAGRWSVPLGIWLEVASGYPAAMAARDAATLSRLVDLDTVVVAAAERAASHAEVVRALLGATPVDFDNEVAHLRGAYNRPSPPRDVTVWSFEGARLRCGGDVLDEGDAAPTPAGPVTRYAAAGPAGRRA